MTKNVLKFKDRKIELELRDEVDISVMREVFKVREYKIVEKIIINANFPILDIGAHVGFFSLYASILNPKNKIYALEPEKNNFKHLIKHIKKNNIKNIFPFELALADKTGERGLMITKDSQNHYLCHSEGSNNLLVKNVAPAKAGIYKICHPSEDKNQLCHPNVNKNQLYHPGEGGDCVCHPGEGGDCVCHPGEGRDLKNLNNKVYKVKTISLKDFLTQQKIKKISLLKMDVEGGEYEVIESLSDGEFKKIENIILEYHNQNGKNYKQIEETLRKNGFGVQIFPSKFDKRFGFLFANNKRLG